MRSGVALVFVLGLLALIMATSVVWLRAGQRLSQGVQIWRADKQMWAQEQAAEELAIMWLTAHGRQLVAPPAGGSWPIIADRWATADADGWLSVVVYDGWAGIPPHLATPRGSLRRMVASNFLDLPIDAGEPIQDGVATDFLERCVLPPGTRRFPSVPRGPSVNAQIWQGAGARVSTLPFAGLDNSVDCLATVLSPHSDGRINCNTAPLAVVEQVLRQQGGLTISDMRQNREQGVMTQPPPDPGGPPGHAILVASTGAWNVHITVGLRGAVRSWWVVMVGSTQVLHIVQRHAVDP